MTSKRVLIISLDAVGENMAGPAIRCWEFARVLSREAQVTLAVPSGSSLIAHGFAVAEYDAERLRVLASESDVLILPGHALWFYPFLKDLDIPLVIDVYDPIAVEILPLLSGQPEGEQCLRHGVVLDALTESTAYGDFFICASERQRSFWLGWLDALGRLNPATYDDDATARRLIDVVPFGIPAEPPTHTSMVLKGIHPGIDATDQVILWGGGVYDWLDPLTLIRAMARISAKHSDVKLFFMGIHHPTPGVSGGEMAERAVTLSRELALLDRCVFFNDWTPYGDRHNYLLEADLGVSLHYAYLETHLSFRTRLVDYIWAGLPMLVTRGDVLSEVVEREGLGWTVDDEDVEQVEAAILTGLGASRVEFADRFSAVATDLRWEEVMQPLISFCHHPRAAADRNRRDSKLHSLPALKLIRQLDALRRDANLKDVRVAELNHLVRKREAKIANDEAVIALKDAELANLRHEVDALGRRAEELEARDVEIEQLRSSLQRLGAEAREQRIEHLDAIRLVRETKDLAIEDIRSELDRVRAEAHAQQVASNGETAHLRVELERARAEALSERATHLEAIRRLRQERDDDFHDLHELAESKDAEIGRLHGRLEAIGQGRVVRFLNSVSQKLRGRPFI